MTFVVVMYAVAATLCAVYLVVGVLELWTGRLVWPFTHRVTDVRAHAWLMLALAGYAAALMLVGLLDRPWWMLLVLLVGSCVLGWCSHAARRRSRTPPVGGSRCSPDLAAEVFRLRPDDRP